MKETGAPITDIDVAVRELKARKRVLEAKVISQLLSQSTEYGKSQQDLTLGRKDFQHSAHDSANSLTFVFRVDFRVKYFDFSFKNCLN